MRTIEKIKRYFERKRVLRQLADRLIYEKQREEQAKKAEDEKLRVALGAIVDDGVTVTEIESLTRTTYPEMAASIDELSREVNTPPIPPQVSEQQMKLDIINKRIGQGA